MHGVLLIKSYKLLWLCYCCVAFFVFCCFCWFVQRGGFADGMLWGFLGIDDSVYGNEVLGAAMGALHFEKYFFSAGFSFCCFVRKDVFGNV